MTDVLLKSKSPERALSAADLGMNLHAPDYTALADAPDEIMGEPESAYEPAVPFPAIIQENDELLQRTNELLADGFAGVILFGPPGTSKSWYAKQIAARLVGENGAKVRLIQFHPSYQYEDFIEGFAPTDDGKFKMVDKTFLELCRVAREDFPGQKCVVVIDEFSRCDVARVFGEALTYLETGKRGQEFSLASGRRVSIPPNIVIVGTMNPWDRGVDEVDAALERRFAKIALNPDSKVLQQMLVTNGLSEPLKQKVLHFFNTVKNHSNPLARIGHAYFRGVVDESSLARLWDHQLSFHFERAFRLDKPSLELVVQNWRNMIGQAASSEPIQAAAEAPLPG